MKTLRDYQQNTIDVSRSELAAGVKTQLFCLSTGMGKTLTAVKRMQDFTGQKIWLTHRSELINQSALAIIKEEEWHTDELSEHILSEAGIINTLRNYKGSMFGDPLLNKLREHIGIIKEELMQTNSNIVVASVQTLHRRLSKLSPDLFEVIVVDECHRAQSRQMKESILKFNTKLRIGLTGTPVRLDGLSLYDLFEKIIVNYDIKYGIDNKYLCELDAYRIRTEISLENVSKTAGDLNQGQLDRAINIPERNKLVVDSYTERAKGRKAMMFCVSVQHAMDLSQAFNDAGCSSTFIIGDTSIVSDDERISRDSLFRSGEIQIMCNVDIYTEGADFPDIGCVGQVAPTMSLTRYLQRTGRGTRIKPDGCWYKDCIILDFVDNTSKHQLINTWTLESKKPVEERIFITKAKQAELILDKQQRQAKITHTLKQDERVILLPLPKFVVRNSPSMRETATEAQVKFMADMGFDVAETSFTKGQANELLSGLPATPSQVAALSRMRYDLSSGVTRGEADLAFKEYQEKHKTSKLINNTPFIGIT